MAGRVIAALAGAGLFVAAAAAADGYPAQVLLSTGASVLGEPVVYPDGAAQVTSAIVTLAPGESTIRHRHGVPMFAYLLEGELTVDYGADGARVYSEGDALMEAMSVNHVGRNTGDGLVRILVVYIGAKGAENVVAED